MTTALRRLFAAFLAAHGVAHVLAFAVAWKLSHPKSMSWTSQIFGGHVDAGPVGIRIIGLLWLAAAVAFVFAAYRVWTAHQAAALTLAEVTLFSTLLCLTQPGRAKVGLAIDLVILGGLAAFVALQHWTNRRTATV